jgi:hypothetical protein
MSQNILTTSSSVGLVRVRAGWDEPLQEIFCSVEPMEQDISESDAAPSCLFQTSYQDVRALLASLREAQIALPERMIDFVRRDCDAKTGNTVRIFDRDGSMQLR